MALHFRVRRELIEVRRLDFSAVTAEIREAHVIGDDDKDIGLIRRRPDSFCKRGTASNE
jgi:hypothetical protein